MDLLDFKPVEKYVSKEGIIFLFDRGGVNVKNAWKQQLYTTSLQLMHSCISGVVDFSVLEQFPVDSL